MPIQEFIRPETEEIAAEVRWDFGFQRVIVVYHGVVVAELNEPQTLRSRGISITTKRGVILDVQLFDDPHGGRFELHENAAPLDALEPKWGTSPDSAGMLHAPSAADVIHGITSFSFERPIHIGQRWLLYLGLLNLASGVATTLVRSRVPENYMKYFDAMKIDMATGVIVGAAFLVLSILTNRSRAIATLGGGLALTTISTLLIGSVLSKDLPFPPITYARFGIHLFGFFLIALGWRAAIDFKIKRRNAFNREGLTSIPTSIGR
jgi:hypothetical protein